MNSSVYQPTTVTFGNNSGPIFPHQTTTASRLKAAFHKTWMRWMLLIGSLFFISLGLIVIFASYSDFEDAIENKDITTEILVHEKEFDIVLLVLGTFFTLFGCILMAIYIKVIDCWRRSCLACPCSYRKQQLARQLQGNGGQIMALNHPSTDPLVCTQYAPISEIPQYEDEEERKKLMQDGTNIAEESQLLSEPSDPRIVLKPSSSSTSD